MSTVIISRDNRKIYHKEYCPYAKKIKKKNFSLIDEYLAKERGYKKCKFCGSVRGVVYNLRKNHGKRNITCDINRNGICIRTDVGFWKLFYSEKSQDWHLFHMNHRGYKSFDPKLPTKVLMKGAFHRQTDFNPTVHPGKAITYIEKHDRNYKLAEENINKMQTNTPKNRHYKKNQKNRKKREAVRNVYKIFNEIEKGTK